MRPGTSDNQPYISMRAALNMTPPSGTQIGPSHPRPVGPRTLVKMNSSSPECELCGEPVHLSTWNERSRRKMLNLLKRYMKGDMLKSVRDEEVGLRKKIKGSKVMCDSCAAKKIKSIEEWNDAVLKICKE